MEEPQRTALKQSIREKIEETKNRITSYRELAAPVSPDNAIGRITRMEAINSKSINDAALSRARAELSQLERALKRVDSPEYGLCRECEEPIPLARLKIMPGADFCVRCAEEKS